MAPERAEMAAPGQPGEAGTVYLLCFAEAIGDTSRPRMSARHYVGWFANPNRIVHHQNGTSGVAIVYAFFQRGIPFVVARTAPGSKTLERRIKNNGHHAEYCPRCSPSPRNGFWAPL
jgi:hypothetical protein